MIIYVLDDYDYGWSLDILSVINLVIYF